MRKRVAGVLPPSFSPVTNVEVSEKVDEESACLNLKKNEPTFQTKRLHVLVKTPRRFFKMPWPDTYQSYHVKILYLIAYTLLILPRQD